MRAAHTPAVSVPHEPEPALRRSCDVDVLRAAGRDRERRSGRAHAPQVDRGERRVAGAVRDVDAAARACRDADALVERERAPPVGGRRAGHEQPATDEAAGRDALDVQPARVRGVRVPADVRLAAGVRGDVGLIAAAVPDAVLNSQVDVGGRRAEVHARAERRRPGRDGRRAGKPCARCRGVRVRVLRGLAGLERPGEAVTAGTRRVEGVVRLAGARRPDAAPEGAQPAVGRCDEVGVADRRPAGLHRVRLADLLAVRADARVHEVFLVRHLAGPDHVQHAVGCARGRDLVDVPAVRLADACPVSGRAGADDARSDERGRDPQERSEHALCHVRRRYDRPRARSSSVRPVPCRPQGRLQRRAGSSRGGG